MVQYDLGYAEREQAVLKDSPTTVVSTRFSDMSYDVAHTIIDSMKDLKMKKVASGAGGAPCLLCDSKKADWMDKEAVESGFPITRTAEAADQKWQQIVKDKEAGIKTKDTKGITQKPITTSNQEHICVTHSLINCTNWFLKLLARCRANVKMWKKEKYGSRGDKIRKANEELQEMIEMRTAMRIDMCNRAGEKTGGSTKGNDGRDFFFGKHTGSIDQIIKEAVPEQFQQGLLELHRDIGVILRIMACTRRVNVPEYRKFMKETNLLLIREFPWAAINWTLHGCLSHSADLMEIYGGRGLGDLSEEALESNNKWIRNFACSRARKTSAENQLSDVMARMLEKSDPYQQELKKVKQRRVVKRPVSASEMDLMVEELLLLEEGE